MKNSVIFKNIKAYKTSHLKDHDAFDGDYNVEVQADGKKARVKSNEFFLQLANDGVSRVNKLNRIGQYGSDAHCSMIVNGKKVYFRLNDFHKLIKL